MKFEDMTGNPLVTPTTKALRAAVERAAANKGVKLAKFVRGVLAAHPEVAEAAKELNLDISTVELKES